MMKREIIFSVICDNEILIKIAKNQKIKIDFEINMKRKIMKIFFKENR
jgi:hypothetical protein